MDLASFASSWTRTASAARAATLGALALVLALAPAADADPVDPAGEEVAAVVYDTPFPVPLLDASYGLEWSAVVELREEDVEPRRVVIQEGQKLAWRNTSSVAQRIAFDARVARAMRCTAVVNFALEDDRLESGLLQTGDVATLCELAPGTYRYWIERDEHSSRRLPLSQRLRGEIVVVGRSVADQPKR